MSETKANRQQLACDYIRQNYMDFNRLRYDLIAQKVQVRCAPSLSAPAEDAASGYFMTTAQISERLVTYGNIKKPMSVSRLGMLMGKMGYKAVTRGGRNARVRGWLVYQRDSEEINANKRLLSQECVTM